jgi:integrase
MFTTEKAPGEIHEQPFRGCPGLGSVARMNLAALFEERYLPHVARTLKPKTVAEYARLARAEILPRLGSRALASFTLDDAEALHAAVPGKVQANRAVSLLSGMLTYAVGRRLLPLNACRGVARNREQGREFFYTPAQTKAILAAASGWDDIRAKYIAVELLTGCRPNELLESGPSWRHGSVLRTPDGKTGGRTIFLPPLACAILDGLAGERYFPAGMDLRRAWVRICRDAGVPRKRLYDLRHTFASAALAAGESLPVIGLTLGHRKAQTTMKYTHLAPEIGLRAATAAAEMMSA